MPFAWKRRDEFVFIAGGRSPHPECRAITLALEGPHASRRKRQRAGATRRRFCCACGGCLRNVRTATTHACNQLRLGSSGSTRWGCSSTPTIRRLPPKPGSPTSSFLLTIRRVAVITPREGRLKNNESTRWAVHHPARVDESRIVSERRHTGRDRTAHVWRGELYFVFISIFCSVAHWSEISARPLSGSTRRSRAPAWVSITSSVGRTVARHRCPPMVEPSRRPRTTCT
jgi:hypothetical protein